MIVRVPVELSMVATVGGSRVKEIKLEKSPPSKLKMSVRLVPSLRVTLAMIRLILGDISSSESESMDRTDTLLLRTFTSTRIVLSAPVVPSGATKMIVVVPNCPATALTTPSDTVTLSD